MGGEEVIIPIVIFGGMTAIAWKYFDTRHKERMSIIEKGLIKEELKYLYSRGVWKTNPYASLKYGLLAAFIGLGILVGAFVNMYICSNPEQWTAGIIFLFGGLGLTMFYIIAKKKMAEEEKEKKQE